ncbi:hypothetical protein [Ensifer sp.]|jgi:hypothetical protein|uniref:hypothetical protein n=1 Tax=Ensifer sp. TaxID=1872086 RepID=UPI002E12643A|nr:hypothetical protein [Ensifer sp.]
MTDPLSKLPMFATDDEIAIAIVGKARASTWKRGALLILEARGFPKVDALHGGRPVPLVRKWYNQYMGVDKSYVLQTLEPAKDNPEAWRPKREIRAERKPQLGLSTRCEKALRHMVEHPDIRTSAEISGARDLTLEQLAQVGALKEGKRDSQGDRTWTVTDIGREEIARINDWHKGITYRPSWRRGTPRA